jgi:hypothetical protein
MSLLFQKATKRSARLRMALIGVAGSGKTYTALNIAKHLGSRVAFLDTERGSASKYSDVFEFDVMEPETFSPQTYIDAIAAAEAGGYDVLIIDSLSHAWTGKEGALEQVDRVARRNQSGNTFGAWRDVTPRHNAMVDAIIGARLHIIATMRAKTEYVQEKNDKTGKTTVRKIGMAPVQRDGLEYEFDVVADLDQDNNLIVGKTRCPALAGTVVPKAGREIAAKLTAWLEDGVEVTTSRNGMSNSVAPSARATALESISAEPVAPISKSDTNPVPEYADDEMFDADAVQCDCGIAARHVRGRSGSGWVCGNFGTENETCNFRSKDIENETDEDPFADSTDSVTQNVEIESSDDNAANADFTEADTDNTDASPALRRPPVRLTRKARPDYALNGATR